MRWLNRLISGTAILVLIYMVIHSYMAVENLENQTLILKNCFEEMKEKHNRLRVIVQEIYERGR